MRACLISAQKAKHLDATTVFTDTLMQTLLSANQSARTILIILQTILTVISTNVPPIISELNETNR